ncbi:MAG: hypothetical protein V5A20_00540 [Salinibacter sp.]|uniref:hypothetical protein n=1 Tax=Salinibacter sp. TaxID=2065818 RepID=UPI002FC2F69C
MGLPLESDRPSVVVDTTLPVGAWEEATFEVEEASDASVLEGTNFPPDASIRAQGSFTPAGGTEQSFTYITELDAEREIEFEPPIEVTNEEPSNVTFSVDVNAWFRTADSTLVNPAQATADRPFQDLVEENIERSIEGFEDDDRDGEEDENEDEDESDNGEEEEEGDDDEDDEDDENEEDEEEKEIEVDLKTSGPDPDASGEAEFEQEPDRTEFKVEVEDLSPGTYEVVVADTTRGQIDVGEGDDDTDGELEFRTPSEAGHPLLDFDPRGRRVAVTQGETVYLEADFPSTEDHD